MVVFGAGPHGLGPSKSYGPTVADPAIVDGRALGLPSDVRSPAAVVVTSVKDTRPIVRAESGGPILLVSGDAEGLIDLAQVGLVQDSVPIRYSASMQGAALARAARGDAVLVVTDTNRKRAQRWDNIRETAGYTERADEPHLVPDTSDNRLEVFPDAGTDTFTVTEQREVQASASGYGMRGRYLPADRAARAFDGDPATAWRVGGFEPVIGQRIRADFDRPVRTGRMNLVQPLTGARDRYITKATLHFSGADGRPVGEDVSVDLGPGSRTSEGQTIRFPERRFDRLEIVVDGDNVGPKSSYPRESPVGFAEIRVRDDSPGAVDRTIDEVVRMPTDLVDSPGARGTARALVFEMTRLRTRLNPPNIAEEEASLVRQLFVPSARDFGIVGTARIAASAPDDAIDRALGIPDASAGGVTARSSQRLRTTLRSRASSAVDGDPTSAWSTDLGDPTGQWVELELPASTRFDHLDLQVVADGRHSVPTRLTVEAGGQSRSVDVPAVVDGTVEAATTTVPVSFEPIEGDRVRVTVDAVRPVTATEYYSNEPQTLPVGIAELGFPGVQRAALPRNVPAECRTDLVSVDGNGVALRVVGDTATAERGDALPLESCTPPGDLRLGRGSHEVRSAPGARTGVDVDGLVLGSAPGGGAVALDAVAAATLEQPTNPVPRLRVTDSGRTRIEGRVRGADGPFWLVLGQSYNEGWRATVGGKDLGPPELVDGMANGWRVDPGDRRNLAVTFTWTPQSRVWIALGISVLTVLACLVILVVTRRRRLRRATGASPPKFGSPLVLPGRPASNRAAVSGVAAVAVGTAVFVTPWVGVVVGVATVAVLWRPRLRPILSFGAPLALAAAGAYVLVQQTRYNYLPLFEWPTYFDAVHVVGWVAVALLATDAVCEVLRGQTKVTISASSEPRPSSPGSSGEPRREA
jgi:arabinofuranan 3-O-arabinosyltransferase